MGETEKVSVRISSDVNLDSEEFALLTRQLRAALLELDVLDVEFASEEPPGGAKGAGAAFGWLWVTIGGVTVTNVVNRVIDWAASNGRSVEITVGDRTLKTSRVSREEQRELIDAFLVQLPPAGSAQRL
jgi:hypothetical protein